MIEQRFGIDRYDVLQYTSTFKETVDQMIRTISHNMESWQIGL